MKDRFFERRLEFDGRVPCATTWWIESSPRFTRVAKRRHYYGCIGYARDPFIRGNGEEHAVLIRNSIVGPIFQFQNVSKLIRACNVVKYANCWKYAAYKAMCVRRDDLFNRWVQFQPPRLASRNRLTL